MLTSALGLLAVLLVVAGVGKVRDPQPARSALSAARLPDWSALVRAAGLVEIAVGGFCIAWPGRAVEGTVAALYLLFAAVIARQLRSGTKLGSCGCLGAFDTPPSLAHVAFNLTAAAIASAVEVAPAGRLPQLVAAHPLPGLLLLGGIAAAARLTVAVFSDLPAALGAYRRPT
jgi:hypothetical protein